MGLRLVVIGSLVALSTLSASAQRHDAGYAAASRDWQGFTPDQRIKLQVLLTAVGFWDTVPNVDLSYRLYEAVRAFQAANGLPSTGFVREPEIDQLLIQAKPILAYWGFDLVRHPFRGHAIWVPMGLGLSVRQDDKGLVFDDPGQRLRLIYRWLPIHLKYTYENVLKDAVKAGSHIDYKVIRDDFFVIARSSGGDKAYTRYHRDGPGIIGFTMWWNARDPRLFGERISTLVSASLRTTMTQLRGLDV
jgi:serine protease Do